MSDRFQRGYRGELCLIMAPLALLLLLAETCSVSSQTSSDIPGCSGKSLSKAEQARCDELLSQRINAASRTSPLQGGWKLVDTADPNGGPDAVSIIHASDTARSDLNLAGLTFRCGQLGIEALLIVLQPLSRAQPIPVTVKNGSSEQAFRGLRHSRRRIGAAARRCRQDCRYGLANCSELSVELEIKPVPIHGVVPVTGLSGAMQILARNCVSRR